MTKEDVIKEFTTIKGVGKAKAELLYNQGFNSLEKLKNAAEVAILIPTGYNLGHVKMGIGNFSGLPELNMERKNSYGVKYRDVMNNFYIEIERCIRLGVEYDLFWNMENLELNLTYLKYKYLDFHP